MKTSTTIGILVAVGMVILALYPSTSMGYDCFTEKDQDKHTYKKIDCTKDPVSRDLYGCQDRCNMELKCKAIVWASSDWKHGKYCCFLKSKTGARKHQWNRVTCVRGPLH
ncbi:hypothetical protein CBR_g39118 [Chara braunii]|uniref:Apple domain-containing protein n=1 Tax=Chara braunii TaxID=69332 RepID=A0A388LQY4_CHABU|nr:hypothetical protein CBR_g39118 [Chara braunii]|eukprot:GBG84740.1 hypothetical protein CBR_g39118 [Chara braunii]